MMHGGGSRWRWSWVGYKERGPVIVSSGGAPRNGTETTASYRHEPFSDRIPAIGTRSGWTDRNRWANRDWLIVFVQQQHKCLLKLSGVKADLSRTWLWWLPAGDGCR